MNLVTDRWIPVVTTEGNLDDANLMQVFTEGEKYADLAVRPHERVALMRLLICIAQAALDGPVDKDDWSVAPKNLPEAARKYLEKWNKEEAFELFHAKKPFLQIAELELIPKDKKELKRKSKKYEDDEDAGLTPLSKMDFAMASGNTTTLFDHDGSIESSRTIIEHTVPISLLTFLNFSPGGLMSASKWGTFIDEGKSKKGVPTKGKTQGKDAPCSIKSMLHTFIRGRSLNETICLNILTKETVRRHYGTDQWGRPVWEQMPKNPEDVAAVDNATKTYLGRLVPLSRWIKIVSVKDGMVWSGGRFVFPNIEDDFPREPTTSIKLNHNRTERILITAEAGKAIWRELFGLLIKKDEENIGGPLSLQNPLPDGCIDIHVCAMIRSKAEIRNLVESVYNVTSKMLTEKGRSIYEVEVEEAEWMSRKLGYAVEAYRRNVDNFWDQRVEMAKKDRKKLKAMLHAKVASSYWTAIEKQRHLLISYVDVFDDDSKYEAAQKAWRNAIHQAARDAFISACGQETPRQIRAFALGWNKLFMEKKTDNEEQNNEGGEE
ncbi:MAG: type I-E CRISPR-associated protein Cse1/CasA [Smithella sp.]